MLLDEDPATVSQELLKDDVFALIAATAYSSYTRKFQHAAGQNSHRSSQ